MRKMLLYRVPGDCHVFGDICDIFGDGSAAYQFLTNIPDYDEKLEWAHRAPAAHTAWCFQHNTFCSIHTGASIRCGGFPCQDFSTAGNQQGDSGKQAPVVATFGRKAIETGNPVLTVENSDRCPPEFVRKTFGCDYNWIFEARFNPDSVGFGCIRRSRQDKPHLKFTMISSIMNKFKAMNQCDNFQSLNPMKKLSRLWTSMSPWDRLYMGAIYEPSTISVLDPAHVLEHTTHCIQRDPPLTPLASI